MQWEFSVHVPKLTDRIVWKFTRCKLFSTSLRWNQWIRGKQKIVQPYQGRIHDFKLGGGGGALKKIAPSGGRHENFWHISCEKITILRQIILFFPIIGGGRTPGAARAPLDLPLPTIPEQDIDFFLDKINFVSNWNVSRQMT
jgi:hypothetical protein